MRPFARKAKVLPFEVEGDMLVLHPTGDMLSVGESSVEQDISELHAAISDNNVRRLVVEFGESPHFGSLVIGAILTVCLRVLDTGGRAAMCHASSGMRDTLTMMRVDTIIPYHDTVEAAKEAVSTDP